MIITKELLEKAYSDSFNKQKFLDVDPCGIVYELMEHTHRQLDIELGALFVAMISWGNRKSIRQTARKMLRDEMKWKPAEFILNSTFRESYAVTKNNCVYRTLNRDNFIKVCENIHRALTSVMLQHSQTSNVDTITLEEIFNGMSVENIIASLCNWLSPARLGTPGKSACKRICMFLRWMIRQGEPDLGLWTQLEQSNLYAVMDVHVCKLTASILKRKQADWKACQELTEIFRSWNPQDPLRYDVALMTIADSE